MKKNRISILALILVCFFSISIVFSGCGSGKDTSSKEDNSKQELVIGSMEDLGGYDPYEVMIEPVCCLVYNNLIELDNNFKKTPGLAESWEMSNNGKKWTFKLKKNVVFHDGTPWNSNVAKINFENRMKNTQRKFLKEIDSIETPDELTLVINLKNPMYSFASEITAPYIGMLSTKAFDENGKVIAAIGTGPFKLSSWEKDSKFVLEKNEKYFGGEPKLNKITFKVIKDPNTRALALESGQIDMMDSHEALTSVKRFKDNSNMKMEKKIGQTSEIIYFNVYNETLKDLNVRKAISYGINLKELVPKLLGDTAIAPEGFFSPVYKEFMDSNKKLPEYNVKKSKELLAEAGYKDNDGDGIVEKNGKKLSIKFTLNSNNEEDKLIAIAMQDELKKIGIDLKLNLIDEASLYNALGKKDYEMIMVGQWYVAHDDPVQNYADGYWHSRSIYTIYSNPEIDSLIDKLKVSTDEKERIELNKEIQGKVIDNCPFIMAFHRNNIIIMNKKVENFDIASGSWQITRGLYKTSIK